MTLLTPAQVLDILTDVGRHQKYNRPTQFNLEQLRNLCNDWLKMHERLSLAPQSPEPTSKDFNVLPTKDTKPVTQKLLIYPASASITLIQEYLKEGWLIAQMVAVSGGPPIQRSDYIMFLLVKG